MSLPPLLLVSEKENDVDFWQKVAVANSLPFTKESNSKVVEEFLDKNPSAFVFWDADPSPESKIIEDILSKHAVPPRVFALTEDPINRQPELLVPPAFGHHIFRRYDGPAPFLYSRLIEAALSNHPSGLWQYFPTGSKFKDFELQKSNDKEPAMATVGEFMVENGINHKLINIGLDALDELLMNALFDAPSDHTGNHYRVKLERNSMFPLADREKVQVRTGVCSDFVGISVTDHFGTLSRETIMKHLCRDFRKEDYAPPKDKINAGLGLHRINQLALALLFVSVPGVKTEVMVFFPNSQSYREFRLGFCFFSIFAK